MRSSMRYSLTSESPITPWADIGACICWWDTISDHRQTCSSDFIGGTSSWTRSAKFCDKLYVRADIFEGQFCATPNTTKNQDI